MLQSNRVLQKEQAELFSIQKKLERVLPVIQEALNSLKVEELHLKSQVVGMQKTTTECTPPIDPLLIEQPQATNSSALDTQEINSQQIDLELFSQLRQFDEEIDSD
ncbi:uncharacterized protein [Drosophila takahashii]|uniref:uncharacterized protein n=1 Tax=Drosophila takahashii TaxID=29030 RepID=UPI0007E75C95